MLSAVVSGFVNGLSFFIFCCVFSSMIFGENEYLHPAYEALAPRPHAVEQSRNRPSGRGHGRSWREDGAGQHETTKPSSFRLTGWRAHFFARRGIIEYPKRRFAASDVNKL